MDCAYPDFWSFTHRDYGNRIGIYRVMRVLDRLGIRATGTEILGIIRGQR